MIGRITAALFAAALAGATACLVAGCDADAAAGPAPHPAAGGVAVVELFTSQGCSSCPSAERALADLNAKTAADHRSVYTLAFHVDYWDNASWRDRFSSAAYSSRQSDYANTLHLNQVYTPQAVVNGTTEFVGSDTKKLDSSVAAALATPAAVPVSVTGVTADGSGGYRVKFTATGGDAGDLIDNVAVVQRGLSTPVKGGENAGSTLDQPSVVRWFKAVKGTANGDVVATPPADVKADQSSVVVYVQRRADGAIVGAAAAPLK